MWALSLAALLSLPCSADATAVYDRYRVMAEKDLWPGFEPAGIPLAIWDGERSWLFGHPSPPEPFAVVEGRGDAFAMQGRHELLRANTSIELAGVPTGTLMMQAGGEVGALAATAIHEAFHVFQTARHPDWRANEVELFTYPFEDAENLARLELERWVVSGEGSALSIAAVALTLRRERYASLAPGAADYERHLELYEGLATYVQRRALGDFTLGERSFPADEIRQRAYDSGMALGSLLDELRPSWREELERGPTVALDVLLQTELEERGEAGAVAIDPELLARELADAEERVAALRDRWAAQRAELLARDGWRVVIEAADGAPLFPANFDPWNVSRISANEVIHGRWLQLSNGAVELECLDHPCLSEATGGHPLFTGVVRLTVTGLESEPLVEHGEDGRVAVSAGGFTMKPAAAELAREDRSLVVRLR